jgi:hypothetical protein
MMEKLFLVDSYLPRQVYAYNKHAMCFWARESLESCHSALYLVRPAWSFFAPNRAAHGHDRCRAEVPLHLTPDSDNGTST